MDKRVVPYIAASCILGVLAAIVLSRSSNLAAMDDEAILFWLVYAVACGVVIHYTPEQSYGSIFLSSIPSPTTAALVFTFKMLARGFVYFSGNKIPLAELPHVWKLLALAWLFSVAGIFIFSLSRDLVLAALQSVFRLPEAKAKGIEQRLNWAVRVITAAALIGKAITN